MTNHLRRENAIYVAIYEEKNQTTTRAMGGVDFVESLTLCLHEFGVYL